MSFFDFAPSEEEGGSFWVNPPFEDTLMESMATHLDSILSNSAYAGVPLTFLVIIPHCPHKKHHRELSGGAFCTHHIVLKQDEHCFYIGTQHSASNKQLSGPTSAANELRRLRKRSNHDSSIFVLQNAPGRKRWPCTAEKERQLREAFQL